MIESLIREFRRESKLTRRVLEAIPADRLDYRPHEKSMSLGQLAFHVAGSPGPVLAMLEGESFALEDMDFSFPLPGSKEEILETLEAGVEKVIAALEAWGEEGLAETWYFTREGKPLNEAPRAVLVRMILFSHLIHHRGQLTIYLRLLDVPVPSVYGPTSDVPDPYRRS